MWRKRVSSLNGSGSKYNLFKITLQRNFDVEVGRPAKVAKDQVVPDVDAYEVGGVEGGTVPPMPRHLGQKEVRREADPVFFGDNKDITIRDFSTFWDRKK